METETPTIVVERDYDGFFERLVRDWCDEKGIEPFKHHTIKITSGPYRSSAVSFRSIEGTLHLDFYSAFRVGFGSLSQEDERQIIALL